MADKFRIAVGSDDAGSRYKDALAADLKNDERVVEVIDVGQDLDEDTHYPHVAVAAAAGIRAGEEMLGWLLDRLDPDAAPTS